MALDFGSIALAVAEGTMEGAYEAQKARDKSVQKRIKELQKNSLERSKSKHDVAAKDWAKRKVAYDRIESAGDMRTRNELYYRDVLGYEKDYIERARDAALNIDADFIAKGRGEEPLLQDYEEDYSGVTAPSVLGDVGEFFGIGEAGPTVDEQIAAIEAKRKPVSSASAVARPEPLKGGYTTEEPEYWKDKQSESERKEAAKKAYLKDKYPNASDAQINDMIYTQEGMKVGPTGIYSTLDEAAAKVMGGDSELQAEKYRNRQQAEANMKNMKSYSMDRNRKDTLMGMFDTSPIISELKLESSAAAGLMANSANMQAELVRKGMDETIAAQVVVAVHEGAVAEGGLFSKGTFDATKVPQAQQIISLWKEDGYYQDKDRILNLVYPQMSTEEVTETPAELSVTPVTPARGGSAPRMGGGNPQEEELVPADEVMTPMQELQVIHKDKIDYYRNKYPNQPVESIIRAMQKKGVI